MNPLAAVPERTRWWLLALLTPLSLALFSSLVTIDQPLRNTDAPQGVVSFEVARTEARAAAVLGSWDAQARARALASLGLDFIFLLVYPLWLAVAAWSIAPSLDRAGRKIDARIGWLALSAIPFDAVENAMLIEQLLDGASGAAAGVAWLCAVLKFLIVIVAGGFVVLGAPVVAWRRWLA